MKLSISNFLTCIKGLVTGDRGINRDILIPLSALELNVVRTVNTSDAGAAADPVVEAGAHFAADETNARVIKVEETIDTIAYLTFPVPRDYDEFTDELKVRVLASQLTVSTDNDVQLDSETYIKTAGSALGSDVSPAAPSTVLSTTEQWITFDLSGLGLERDDVVTFKLNTDGHNDTNGEEVLIHAVKVSYVSTFVSYDEEDSSGNLLR